MTHAEPDWTHLSQAELVDALDGALDQRRRRHLRRCESCRTQLAALGDVVAAATDVEVPDPSPLFWAHLATRVRTVINREPRTVHQHATWWPRSHRLATSLGTAAVLLVIALNTSMLQRTRTPDVMVETLQGSVSETGDLDPLDLIDQPADWALLLTVVDTLDWEDTDLLFVDSDTVAALVSELSDEEQRTLVHLIEVEMEQAGL